MSRKSLYDAKKIWERTSHNNYTVHGMTSPFPDLPLPSIGDAQHMAVENSRLRKALEGIAAGCETLVAIGKREPSHYTKVEIDCYAGIARQARAALRQEEKING